MAKQLIIKKHDYAPDLSGLLALNRTELKTVLICGLTATLWVRFLNAAFRILLPHVNIQFVATDRFPPESEFVSEAHATYGLPFRRGGWYEQFDLRNRFSSFSDSVKEGCFRIKGEMVKIDAVICTTTPDLNLNILELFLAQGVMVYIDKPLVKFEAYQLKRVAELKRQYPHLVIAGDFFIYSPVIDWAIKNLTQLVPGYRLLKIIGACTEPWTLKGEQNNAGNRVWMPDPAISKGIGGNDCGVHVLGVIHYFLTQLGFATRQTRATEVPICGRYLQDGKTDLQVETAFFGNFEIDDVSAAIHAGKGFGSESYYGLQLWFDSARVNLMVGTPRYFPHVAVEDRQTITVHQLRNGGLGYTEIGADLLTCLYGGERGIRKRQANTFAGMHAASCAIDQSYLAFNSSGGTFADYEVGTNLPGVPAWASLKMPDGMPPDNNIAIGF